MVIELKIKYNTRYGQSLYIRIQSDMPGNKEGQVDKRMEYFNDEYWQVHIETGDDGLKDTLTYCYIVKEPGIEDISDHCRPRTISFKKKKAESISVIDEWQVEPLFENVFSSKPFADVYDKGKTKGGKKQKAKKHTHIFKVFVPHLQEDKVVCITGSAKEMNEWNDEEPVLLGRTKDCWIAHINLYKEAYPIQFKFGVYDLNKEKIIHFEEGNNRVIENPAVKDKIEVYHVFPGFDQFKWRGTGINIPVSALKTEQSWGVGDFTDLNLLIDWAKSTGIKLIQLLPINDTTATHSIKDSYPYASISAFALHPLYLNVKKLLLAAAIEPAEEMMLAVNSLNDKPELDYEAVAKIKSEAIKELYFKEKDTFKDDYAFFQFFDLNRNWLVPYAAFCYLRDNNNTANPSFWDDYKTYDEASVQELVNPENSHYDEIAIHYFTQYHLHLQLLDAVEYAHKNGIILKGDLPIGVGRHSVETWMYPGLFHLDMQAGAPPDAFAVKGQNWEFPTYNWEEMAKNNYAWWRQRMEHMSNYFDAIRIDDILGFFRIWSIRQKDIEGIQGIFAPSLPLSVHDFEGAGVRFNERRLCDPYITDEIVSLNFPGNEEWIKENILESNEFKRSLDTQQKLSAFLKNNPSKAFLQKPLFDLVTDRILLKDDMKPGHFHFRINMQDTTSYKHLSYDEQEKLNGLYRKYFFGMQDDLWKEVGQEKLNALQLNTSMLLCAEDLGMVPGFVESVLKEREILCLQVQRMPKKIGENFSHPRNAIYLSVVTPSTHDMSTIRQWWEDDKEHIQYFYNYMMGQQGIAPFYCEPWICREIIRQHLDSPAMWAVFLLQDLMGIDDKIRRENPAEERINIPANPDHNWVYRMHLTLEKLISDSALTASVKSLVKDSGR